MNRKLLITLLFSLFATLNISAQHNPVENLIWSHWYEYPNNFFELTWEEPLQPHNEIIGYNIYRDGELFQFQTEMTLYSLWSPVYGSVSNCDQNFLDNGNPMGFDIHVTAVYNPDVESGYVQTAHCDGPLLGVKNFTAQKAVLYPNPTNGILNIGKTDLEKIAIYDASGKMIKTFAPASKIDLSDFSKGVYFVKLFSAADISVDKIVIE